MALTRDMDLLRGAPVFACLDDDALRLLAFSAEPRKVPVGEVIYRRGEAATGAVLIVSGRLALDGEHEDGVAVSWVGPGTLLDEPALLAASLRQTTATVTDAATVMTVPRSSMLRALNAYPANAAALRRYWARRLGRRIATFKDAVRP